MEFLVRQCNRMTPSDDDLREKLRPLEREYAQQLRERGVLLRLWRVPGSRDAIGLYRVRDATELHDVLSALPMFPWLHVQIQPLAVHPQEQA